MVEELGRIERPAAESFLQGRKLFVVPLLFRGEDSPAEYVEKFDMYWKQVTQQVSNLEARLEPIKHVYHESISQASYEGLRVLETLNRKSYEIAAAKCRRGAQLEATEDPELAGECMDWERCLLLSFISRKVAQAVYDSYLQATRSRYEHIARRIDETLKADESGILIVREGHRVQFPNDIQVFSVSPPALDQIHQWIRDLSSSTEAGQG